MIELFTKRKWLKATAATVIAAGVMVMPVSAIATEKGTIVIPQEETEGDLVGNPTRVHDIDFFNERTKILTNHLEVMKNSLKKLQRDSETINTRYASLSSENSKLKDENERLALEVERLKQ